MRFLDRLRGGAHPEPGMSGQPPTSNFDVKAARARELTAESAGEPVDLGYITGEFLETAWWVDHATDIGQVFEHADAEKIIATYDGEPLGSHIAVFYGHHAARVALYDWRFQLVRYENGEFIADPTIVRGSPKVGRIVGRCTDGSALWEFRL